jgi:hypothetical protein
MKTVVHPLLIAVLALPFLPVSRAFAGGPGIPPPFAVHRLTPGLPHLESESHDFLHPGQQEDRNAINDGRMSWRDRDGDPLASPPPPEGGPGGASAPLDGGISLLLAAGIGLGLKRAMGKKKASDKDGTSDEEGTIIP